VVDGESLLLELLRSDAESETQSISWTLTAPAALNCETLSREAGVDFDFRKLTSIDSIVSSDGGNSCTITATSSVGTAQFGTSSLSIAGDFSVQDAAGRTHATVTSGDTDILVTIEAHSGEGHVSTDAVLGDAPGQIATELSRGLFSGSFGPTPSQMISLEATGLVNAHQDVRGETLMVDNSKFTFHGDPLASRSPHHLTAGESIILKLKVAHEVADVSSLAIFVKTGVDSWTYAGSGAFDKETFIASTGAFSLHDGIYNIRLFVVSKSWSIAPVSLNSDFGGFLGRFTPTLTTMSISESGLPQVNKSHEAVIYVTSSTDPVQPTDPAEPTGPAEPTVPDDSSSGDSGSDSDVDQEPSPVETEEPAPAETEEPGPVETEDPEQSSPGSVTETETGGQLPDTDTTGFNWLVPLGIAGGLAVLGAIVFLSRRRLV
jgi:LPXTG-motif cell wall-anchored protein